MNLGDGIIDSGDTTVSSGSVLYVDAAQFRSFPRETDIITSGSVLILDAGNPVSYPGTGTLWKDLSGNNNNGTLTLGPTFSSADGGSIVFDGTNDYVDCGNGASINIVDNLTVNFWFKINAHTGTWQGIVSKRNGNANGLTNYAFNFDNVNNLFQFYYNSDGTNFRILNVAYSTNFTIGVWYNICGTFAKNGTSTDAKLYKNGTLLASSTLLNNVVTTPVNLLIGDSKTATPIEPFKGNVSNVQIYNRALSAAEVLANYDAQKFRFGITGTTLYDLTSNANTLTLYNGAFYTGSVGGSIRFDGTNDGVSGSNAAVYTITNNISIEVWMNLNISGNLFIIGKGPSNGVATFYPGNYELQTGASNKLSFLHQVSTAASNTNFQFFDSAINIYSNNTWTHVVLTCNGTTGVIYINGVANSLTRGGTVGSIISTNTETLKIGRRTDGTVMQGNIAIARLYNRILSATEAKNNFDSTKSRFGYFPPSAEVITNGLQLYLDSKNTTSNPGSGTAWNDISGNNRNFNWVSTPTRGTDTGVPYFTTLGNRCTGPASNSFGINNTTGYTVFLVMKQLTLVETSAFKFYSSNGTGAQSRGIFSHCTWVDNVIYFDQGGCCATNQRTNVASGGLTAWNIIVFRSTVTTRSIFKNASNLVTNSTSAANINLTTTAVDLGSSDEYGGNSSTWNARIAGFLVYNRGLSDAEVSQNITVLRSNFGI